MARDHIWEHFDNHHNCHSEENTCMVENKEEVGVVEHCQKPTFLWDGSSLNEKQSATLECDTNEKKICKTNQDEGEEENAKQSPKSPQDMVDHPPFKKSHCRMVGVVTL
eukprot:11360720-Ditylum_brightwellii.AAC.1